MVTTQEIAPHAIVDNINTYNKPKLEVGYYLRLALFYASLGFKVFPLMPNKKFYKGLSWTKVATNNPDEIIELWRRYPYAVPAFYALGSRILVIDIDNKPEKGKHGFKVISRLVKQLGKLPKTIMVYTQSGGIHLYYILPEDREFVRNIENCIDIQVNACCICGGVYSDKGSYRFVKGHTFEDIGKPAELTPEWVEFLAKSTKVSNKKKSVEYKEYKPVVVDGDFSFLYETCAFCRFAVNNQPELPEIGWFAFASILSRVNNGYQLFDQISQNHPDYDTEKTRKKFEQGQKYYAGCSCASKVFAGCENCEYR